MSATSVCLAGLVWALCLTMASAAPPVGRPHEVQIKSSVDGTSQPAIVQVPTKYRSDAPAPLLVGLHTWSAGYKQQVKAMAPRARRRGWLLVLPNFRGPNLTRNPVPRQACASILAQHDVVDAVRYMTEHYAVDANRVYLVGASGGGHMTMMMAAKYPDLWAAASAWVGISDLRQWQGENKGYAAHVHACTGGKPGDGPEVDWEYVRRSPIHFIQNASNLWLDLRAGRHDRSVPCHHTIDAYERLALVPGHRGRLTVFDGGHEIRYDQALDWLSKQRRAAQPPRTLWLTTDEEKGYYYVHLAPARPSVLGHCKVSLADGRVELAVGNVSKAGLDVAAAGLAGVKSLDVVITSDGKCAALTLIGVDRPSPVRQGWEYSEAARSLELPCQGIRRVEAQVRW